MCETCINYDESLDGHLNMLSNISCDDYAVDSFIVKDEALPNTVFMEILRSKRRSMTKAQRDRWYRSGTKGKLWMYPFSIEKQYQAWITKKIQEFSEIALPVIKRNMERWVKEYSSKNTLDGFTKDEYDDEIDLLIATLREKQQQMFQLEQEALAGQLRSFAEVTSTQNQGEFEKFQKLSIGTTFQPEESWFRGTVSTWVTNNRSLIRGMTDEYIQKLEFKIASGFQEGLTSSSIIKNILAMDENMTIARARLLGRDQIGKLNGLYSKARAQQAGLSYYEWMTAGDERVRATHKLMDGTINLWEDSSVYSKDNGGTFISRPTAMQGATPGSQIQCRCTQVPFFDEIMGTIDREIEGENNDQ